MNIKYRILQLASPIYDRSIYRKPNIYNYSIQQEKKFLWFRYWKTTRYAVTIEDAMKKVNQMKSKIKKFKNKKSIIVWSDE